MKIITVMHRNSLVIITRKQGIILMVSENWPWCLWWYCYY